MLQMWLGEMFCVINVMLQKKKKKNLFTIELIF